MAALTENTNVVEKEGVLEQHPVAASASIFRGALCKIDADGYLDNCGAEAGSKFAGISEQRADNSSGADGDINCDVKTEGTYLLGGTGFAQADVGSVVYASDSGTITKTSAANLQVVGRIVGFVSSTQVYVKLGEEGTVLGS